MHARGSIVLGLLLLGCGEKTTPKTVEAATEPADSRAAIAASVEAALDRAADPCTDFYRFACGGWLDRTTLPSDRPIYGRGFSTIQDRNQEIVRDILERPAEGADPRLATYYDACVDGDALEAGDAAGLRGDLGRLAAAASVEELFAVLADLPFSGSFLGAFVEADFKAPDVNMFHLVQGGLGLPERGYYLPEGDEDRARLLADYRDHVGRMLALAGLDPAQADAVLGVETRLAQASRAPAELRDIERLYHPMSVAQLAELSPGVPWAVIFQGLGLQADRVNVLTPEFFPALGELLTSTPLDDLKAYAAWHLVHDAAPFLPARFDREHFAFYGQRLSGTPEQRPRWQRCVDATDAALGELLGRAFVERAFAGESKDKALAMIGDVRAAFAAGLPELSWMDPPTRARALEKLDAITHKIGYPDRWETYEGLALGPDAYANMAAVARWQLADQLSRVGEPVDKAEWAMSPPTVNAYYNPLVNEIVFPAGILQPPFFDAAFPAAMNYGAIGMVVGHEITHGFDDEGRKFGPTGKLEAWWDEAVSARFEEQAQCIGETYAALEVQPGVRLDGELTKGENIADFGGIKLATRAYQQFLADGGQDWTVAGFTPEQLLFVGYAQSWCSLATPEIEQLRARTDPHAPPRFRVNVPLSHLPAFWDAFQCEAGDAMRVDDACTVW